MSGIPDRFGKCVIERKLGEGGMGAVYLARHETLGLPVAVKILPPDLAGGDPKFASRFVREARLAGQLRHPNIVSVLDAGIQDGHHYLVMEYIEGPTCREKVEKEGKLPWSEAVHIVRQAADGLGYAARKGIIHRDVTSDNIMLDSDGAARVTDMGLARDVASGGEGVTQTGTSLGTPYYMSPEQINNAKDVDFRSDIYSLGITFYHLVCGCVPYTGTTFEIMSKHVHAPLPSPKKHTPDLPDGVCDVIRMMTAKKPDDRYQTYEELCEDLDRLFRNERVSVAGFRDRSTAGADGGVETPPAERPGEGVAERSLQNTIIVGPRAARRRIVLYVIAAAAALVAAALAATLLLGS